MDNPHIIQAKAQKLSDDLFSALKTVVDTGNLDRAAFIKLLEDAEWSIPSNLLDDSLDDAGWLWVMREVHDDIQTWAMPGLADSIEAMNRGDLIELSLDDFDPED